MKKRNYPAFLLSLTLLTTLLAACGTSTTPAVVVNGQVTTTVSSQTTAAVATTTPATASTTVATTTPVAIITTAVTTTVSATTATTAAPTNGAIDLQATRKTNWLELFKSDPKIKIETPDSSIKGPYINYTAINVGGYPNLDDIVYVDMDGDGVEEAAIPLYSGGTAGNVFFVVYRYATPSPQLVDWKDGYKFGLKLENGKLTYVGAVYAGWEPNCCPSGTIYTSYILKNNHLTEVASRSEGHPEAQIPTVEQFYNFINGKDLASAYKLLDTKFRAANPYAKWAAGYANTKKVEAQVLALPGVPNAVQVRINSTDAVPGAGDKFQQFYGTWKLSWDGTSGGWAMGSPDIRVVVQGTGAAGISGGGYTAINPAFQSVLAKLKSTTKIPLLLPGYLPTSDKDKVYVSVQKVTVSLYDIEITLAPDCNYAGACHAASVHAEQVAANTATPEGEVVYLSKEMVGYYQPFGCGASCSDSAMVWQQGNVRYTVTIKAGNLEQMLRMANSAIVLGPQ